MNLIVPNVHWGMGLPYEADMVVLRPSGFAIEVEIKVTKSDIKADAKKHHFHNSNLFREFWYAMPENIIDLELIHARAGVLAICEHKPSSSTCISYHYIKTIRPPVLNKVAKQWDDQRRLKLAELGAMRIWALKSHIVGIANDRRYRDSH
jgi:hypothetical protein